MAAGRNGAKYREFALAFFETAKEDLATAESLIEDKRYANSIFHCQQCVEKSTKSVLEMERFFIGEHDLSRYFLKKVILKFSDDEMADDLNEVLRCLEWFKGKWKDTRYPIEIKGKVVYPKKKYDKKQAQNALNKAQFVLDTIRKLLEKKYKLKVKS